MLIDWMTAPDAPQIRHGARRRVVTSEQATVVRVDSAPDAPFDGVAHRHEHEQWVLVLEGTLGFRCGDTSLHLQVGDLVHVPPRQWHAATGTGPTGAAYLEISVPPRLDLLPGSLVDNPLQFEEAHPRAVDRSAVTPPRTNAHPLVLTVQEDDHAR